MCSPSGEPSSDLSSSSGSSYLSLVLALESPETEGGSALVVAKHPNPYGVSPDIVKKVKWKTMKVGSAESACIEMIGLGIRDSLLKLRHEFVMKIIPKL